MAQVDFTRAHRSTDCFTDSGSYSDAIVEAHRRTNGRAYNRTHGQAHSCTDGGADSSAHSSADACTDTSSVRRRLARMP